MSTPKTEDGEANERGLLVDDIQRLREVLHISGGTDKISSDEEVDDGSEEDEDEPQKCGESLTGLQLRCMLCTKCKNAYQSAYNLSLYKLELYLVFSSPGTKSSSTEFPFDIQFPFYSIYRLTPFSKSADF